MERRGINHYHILTFHARLTHHQYPCVHPFNHTTKPISLSKPSPTCGILPKNCRVAPSPLRHVASLIPPGHLTSGILLRRHSTWISHIRNSVRPTFHILRIFRSRRLSPSERGERFNFPGQTCPDPLVTLTRTAWLIRRSRFAGSISAHNKKSSDNTDDQVS